MGVQDEDTAEALSLLADASAVPHLSELRIADVFLDYALLERFVAALPAGRLKVFAPWCCGRARPDTLAGTGSATADAFAAALIASPAFQTLDHLDLAGHVFSPATVRDLIDAAAGAGIGRFAVEMPRDDPGFARYSLDASALDQFTSLGLLYPDHLSEVFGRVQARLGTRAAPKALTGHWFAAQRRWNPL